MPSKMPDKISFQFPNITVPPFNLENGYVISSHTLNDGWNYLSVMGLNHNSTREHRPHWVKLMYDIARSLMFTKCEITFSSSMLLSYKHGFERVFTRIRFIIRTMYWWIKHYFMYDHSFMKSKAYLQSMHMLNRKPNTGRGYTEGGSLKVL